jgi:glycosyltransferase involved in cell wall biosynthesis
MQNNLLNKGVRFFSLKMNDLFILFHILFVVYIIRKNKIEVLHAHQRLPILIACIAGRIARVPVIVTVHGSSQRDLRSAISIRIPDMFIFVRQYIIDDDIEYRVPLHKTIVIPNGVSILNPLPDCDFNSLCYISRIDKRHSSLISMIIRKVIVPVSEDYPEVILNIVGDGDYLDDLRQEAEIINRQLKREAIIIHGYMTDVKGIIQKSGLVLGVGRVAIETLSCGVSLLSVNHKFLGTVISQDNYPFYKRSNFVSVDSPPPTEGGLIRSLQDYFKNHLNWKKEALLLQKRIDEDFNMLRVVTAITNLYKKEIELKKGG